jgi:hypothetical protein
MKSRILLLACYLLLFAAPMSAQTAAKRTPEQLRASYDAHKGDFDYLLGDWEFTASSREYGTFRGYWSAVRLQEGQILDEYRVVGDKGETYYVTTSLRNYNTVLDRWELVGADAGTGLQDMGTGRRIGKEMHIEQKFGVMSDSPSLWKIRYYDIRPDRFSWTADRSTDGGKTWVRSHQTIEARRIGPARFLEPLAPARKVTAPTHDGATAGDVISGNWGEDGATFLELKFDGRGDVSGTAIWRSGSQPEVRSPIKVGTFDPKTGALKIEGEAHGRDGVRAPYVIQGTLANGTLEGTYLFGGSKGRFTFTRK